MTPWSIGCKTDVVLVGKKINLTFDRSAIVGCAWQLSIIKTIFQFSFRNFTSSSQTYSSKRVLSIQLFFWDLYLHSKDVTFSKHLGTFDFPLTMLKIIVLFDEEKRKMDVTRIIMDQHEIKVIVPRNFEMVSYVNE